MKHTLMTKKRTSPARLGKTAYIILSLSILVAAYVLIPQLDAVQESFIALREVNPVLMLIAVIATFLTFMAASLTLTQIAVKKIIFGKTLQVQVASGFATKLAPAGIGGFALNTRYLTKQRHSVVQASSVMALNGLLGFIGHVCIIITALLFAKETLEQTVVVNFPDTAWWLIVILLLTLVLAVVCLKGLRKRIRQAVRQLQALAVFFANKPGRLLLGFLGALLVTLLYTLTLFVCAAALGVQLNLLQSLLVFTAGAIGASVTPTPGGLGGAEAALTAALIAVGLDSGIALSVALTYRLVTYWIPILPGFIFFHRVLSRNYI